MWAYIGDGLQQVVNVPENGRRFQRVCSLQLLGSRFNHVATRTSIHCIIPRLNMTKPGVTRNSLRVMVVCCRSLRTDLQCNLLSPWDCRYLELFDHAAGSRSWQHRSSGALRAQQAAGSRVQTLIGFLW